jgi:putative inorganic carbon (hco3(-)) transporter
VKTPTTAVKKNSSTKKMPQVIQTYRKNGWLIAGLLMASVLLAYLVANTGIITAVVGIGVFAGVGMMLGIFADVRFGLLALLVASYFLSYFKRMLWQTDIPLGLIMEALLIIMLIAVLFRNRNQNKASAGINIFTVAFAFYFIYNILEVFNPDLASRQAWGFIMRGQFVFFFTYLVALNVIDDLRTVRLVIQTMLILITLAAVYGLYQEFFGFLPFEQASIDAFPEVKGLVFTFGRWRRFSFMSGPMIFGIVLTYSIILCVGLLFGPFRTRAKIYIGIAAFLMLWAVIYTGTRTAYLILPAGFLFFALLTFQRRILIFTAIALGIGTAIILSPLNHPVLFIVRTAFEGSKDPSYQVRVMNQERIKPFIRTHPFGAGLGSVGGNAAKYTPGTYLSKFPPDSEYVKIAIEQGWFGLLIYCLLLFSLLKTGIDGYFAVRDARLKAWYAGIVSAVFVLILANYPQEAMDLTTRIFFSVSAALLVKMRQLEPENKSKLPSTD